MDATKLEKIECKVDKIQESVHNIDVTLGRQHESLLAHMKRTNLLEKLVFMTLAAFGALAMAVLRK